MRFFLLAPFALFLAGCDIEDIASGAREQEEFQMNFPLRSGGRLVVENYNGSIEITAWDQESVEIHGTKFANTKEQLKEVHIDGRAVTADSVTVRTVPPVARRGNTGARYVIRVPRRVQLERITSSNGSARVDGVEGLAKIQTSNGAIRIGQHKGSLDMSTSNGSIEVRTVSGPVTARTSNGRISVDEAFGSVDAATSNGSIVATLVETPADKTQRFTTTNGGIELTVKNRLLSDLRVSTSNGGVTVRLPAVTNARVAAATSNNSITNEFPLTGDGATNTKKRIEGKIGNGGPTIDISTSNGSIRLLRSGV